MKRCKFCGKQSNAPEGSAICPEYFGFSGDGYCPMLWDGNTMEEQAALGFNEVNHVHQKADLAPSGRFSLHLPVNTVGSSSSGAMVTLTPTFSKRYYLTNSARTATPTILAKSKAILRYGLSALLKSL